MTSRDELLQHLWTEVIDANLDEAGLGQQIDACKRDPDGAFADTGAAIERLLAAGAASKDLAILMRHTAYEAVFGTLYALEDPGIDDEESIEMLFEDLLGADPSGREGRPAPNSR